MTVLRVHLWSLTATLALPVLGLLSGSTLLLGACLVYFAVLVGGMANLHDPQRGSVRTWSVHGLTLVGLISALVLFPRAQVDSGLIIVMLGIFNRFLLRAGQRDDMILVGAACVLLVAATVITPGFSFALIILAFVPAALWAMLSASILGLAEREGTRNRAQLQARYGGLPAPRLTGSLTGGGLGLMLAGYIAVSFLPRARFAPFLSAGGLMTFGGASSRMNLGTGGVNSGADGRVAVRLEAPAGEVEGLYAKVYALDSYDGRGFFDSEGTHRRFDAGRGQGDSRCREVVLKRQAPRRQPHPVAILGRTGPSALLLLHGRTLDRYDSGTWTTYLPGGALEAIYRVCLDQPVAASFPLSPDARREVLARFTQLPNSLDARIEELSRTLIRDATDPEVKLQRVLGHFDSGFRYSLDPLPGTDDDPLVRFLFEAKTGHCELYAAAVAVLLRVAGVPARVAAGYYGGWYNRRSRSLELGSEDAHAWVEVLIDGKWRWVDATPPSLRARRTHKRFAWAQDLWDALEAAWYEYVIDFDEARRRAALSELEASLGFGPGAAPQDVGGRRTARERFDAPRLRWVVVVVAILAAAAALFSMIRSRGLVGVGRELRRLVVSPGADPRLPLGAQLASLPPSIQDSARYAVDLYECARFGDVRHRPDLGEVRRAVRQLAAEVRKGRRGTPQPPASSSG